jgi:hypothetical protein
MVRKSFLTPWYITVAAHRCNDGTVTEHQQIGIKLWDLNNWIPAPHKSVAQFLIVLLQSKFLLFYMYKIAVFRIRIWIRIRAS